MLTVEKREDLQQHTLAGSQATVMVAKLDEDEQPCYNEQADGAQRPAGVALRS